MKRHQDIVLFSSLSKLKEHESKNKNIHFYYPNTLTTAYVEKIYEALTMCVYLFADTLENPPKLLRFGYRRSTMNFHCRIVGGNFLFTYGRTQSSSSSNVDFIERATVLYNLLVFEFGCLVCVPNQEKLWTRITSLLDGLDETVSPMFHTAIPRLRQMEPIIGQKAFNLLRVCQRQKSVVGGCIFYKHELLADHFSNHLTHILAVLQRTNKTFGSRTLLPDNNVNERLQNVRLRQGVSLSVCYVPKLMFPKNGSGMSSQPAQDDFQDVPMCSCLSSEHDSLDSVARLCCLASRAVLNSQRNVTYRSERKGEEQEKQKLCAPQHEELETMLTYVEAHSDIFLCLLLRENELDAAQGLFDALYKLCFVLLRDLELCILRARDRDNDREQTVRGARAATQYHGFINSFRLKAEDKTTMQQHRVFLNRVHQAFRRDDDLETVELSNYISTRRRGWKEIAYIYEE